MPPVLFEGVPNPKGEDVGVDEGWKNEPLVAGRGVSPAGLIACPKPNAEPDADWVWPKALTLLPNPIAVAGLFSSFFGSCLVPNEFVTPNAKGEEEEEAPLVAPNADPDEGNENGLASSGLLVVSLVGLSSIRNSCSLLGGVTVRAGAAIGAPNANDFEVSALGAPKEKGAGGANWNIEDVVLSAAAGGGVLGGAPNENGLLGPAPVVVTVLASSLGGPNEKALPLENSGFGVSEGGGITGVGAAATGSGPLKKEPDATGVVLVLGWLNAEKLIAGFAVSDDSEAVGFANEKLGASTDPSTGLGGGSVVALVLPKIEGCFTIADSNIDRGGPVPNDTPPLPLPLALPKSEFPLGFSGGVLLVPAPVANALKSPPLLLPSACLAALSFVSPSQNGFSASFNGTGGVGVEEENMRGAGGGGGVGL